MASNEEIRRKMQSGSVRIYKMWLGLLSTLLVYDLCITL